MVDILAIQCHDDLSGLRHAVVEAKKIESFSQRYDMCLLSVERKAQPFDVAFQSLKTSFCVISVMGQRPCIIHVPDVVLCVHPFLHVVIHWVQKRDPGNLDHLRTGVVPGITDILRIQHSADHLIDLITEIPAEVLLDSLMAHIGIVAVDIRLYHPSVKTIVAIKAP